MITRGIYGLCTVGSDGHAINSFREREFACLEQAEEAAREHCAAHNDRFHDRRQGAVGVRPWTGESDDPGDHGARGAMVLFEVGYDTLRERTRRALADVAWAAHWRQVCAAQGFRPAVVAAADGGLLGSLFRWREVEDEQLAFGAAR